MIADCIAKAAIMADDDAVFSEILNSTRFALSEISARYLMPEKYRTSASARCIYDKRERCS